jgi:hypothetical protein
VFVCWALCLWPPSHARVSSQPLQTLLQPHRKWLREGEVGLRDPNLGNRVKKLHILLFNDILVPTVLSKLGVGTLPRLVGGGGGGGGGGLTLSALDDLFSTNQVATIGETCSTGRRTSGRSSSCGSASPTSPSAQVRSQHTHRTPHTAHRTHSPDPPTCRERQQGQEPAAGACGTRHQLLAHLQDARGEGVLEEGHPRRSGKAHQGKLPAHPPHLGHSAE